MLVMTFNFSKKTQSINFKHPAGADFNPDAARIKNRTESAIGPTGLFLPVRKRLN